jgi:hypothetical protein
MANASAAQGSPPTEGSTSPAPPARTRYVLAAYALAGTGVVVGAVLYCQVTPTPPVAVPGVSVFAGYYVAAQAIERIIEPFSNQAGGFLGGFPEGTPGRPEKTAAPLKKTLSCLKKIVSPWKKCSDRPETWRPEKAELARHRRDMRHKAAGAQLGSREHTEAMAAADAMALFRANSTVLMWGLASLAGCLLSGGLGLLLLHSVGVQAPEPLDVAVTGLALGAGTKPLHDLIGNLAASKEKKQDAA